VEIPRRAAVGKCFVGNAPASRAGPISTAVVETKHLLFVYTTFPPPAKAHPRRRVVS
jgi:hypothetical protein